MGVLFGLALALVCAVVLALPFLRARRSPMDREMDDLAETTRQREAVYDEIRTLQLERDVGRMEQQEYEVRLRRLRLEAAAILRNEERLMRSRGERTWALEEEIRSIRQQFTPPESGQAACPNCSVMVGRPASECPECGAPLTEEDAQ